MTPTFADVRAHPDNAGVLAAIGDGEFEMGARASPFDEGGQIFFVDYAKGVPAVCRATLGITNLLVHERTARVFAFHQGRFTIAVRTGDPDGCLVAETMDGPVDLSALGPGWELLGTHDPAEVIRAAHALAGA